MRPTTRSFARRLAALLLALSAPLASAEPALWKIENGERDVYLFGTMHALPKDLPWLSDATQRALVDSRRLVVEMIPDPTLAEKLGPFMREHGFYAAGGSLSAALGEADWRRLTDVAASLGLPADRLEPMRPWAVWFALATPALAKAGFDPALGADGALVALAQQRKRRVLAIEEPVAQLERVAQVDEAQQVAMLRMFLDDYPRTGELVRELHTAWAAGDEGTLARLAHDPLRRVPGLYEALMAQRNREWVAAIRSMLDRDEAAFVAVGVAHLVGADGVPSLLRAAGVDVERL